jgi:hypothetical protein
MISAQTRTVTALNGDRVTDFKGFYGCCSVPAHTFAHFLNTRVGPNLPYPIVIERCCFMLTHLRKAVLLLFVRSFHSAF